MGFVAVSTTLEQCQYAVMRQARLEAMLLKVTSSRAFNANLFRRTNRVCNAYIHRAGAVTTSDGGLLPVESACTVCRAEIGHNQAGFRGLIASEVLSPGEVVLSVPLYNSLQVPEKLETTQAIAAAQEALVVWQQHHGPLPTDLLSLIMDPLCPWEAKLVYWLLHLRTTAAPDTLWHSYSQHLPSQQETLSFYCYSEQQAEQLQFSTWKSLAARHRQLLHDVQQQCSRVPSVAAAASSSSAAADDITWALSMVKSRTFARAMQQQPLVPDSFQGSYTTNSSSSQYGKGSQLLNTCRASQLQLDSKQYEICDDDDIMLLMVPFVDMINHSQNSNCAFRLDWDSQCFQIISTSEIQQGSEITICYGSSKSNLALLSCYGFFIPGNQNDAQLLQPIFSAAVAAAGGQTGLQQDVVQAAVAARLQELHAEGAIVAAADYQAQLSRVACAAASLPADQAHADAGDHSAEDLLKQWQLQRYAIELTLYQISLMLKLCGSTVEEDAELLQAAVLVPGDNSGSTDQMIMRQIVAARLEQKQLLLECRGLCQHIARDVAHHLAAHRVVA